jgi:hypothetical protein
MGSTCDRIDKKIELTGGLVWRERERGRLVLVAASAGIAAESAAAATTPVASSTPFAVYIKGY